MARDKKTVFMYNIASFFFLRKYNIAITMFDFKENKIIRIRDGDGDDFKVSK